MYMKAKYWNLFIRQFTSNLVSSFSNRLNVFKIEQCYKIVKTGQHIRHIKRKKKQNYLNY